MQFSTNRGGPVTKKSTGRNESPDDVRVMVDALSKIAGIAGIAPGETPGLYETYRLLGRIHAIAQLALASFQHASNTDRLSGIDPSKSET